MCSYIKTSLVRVCACRTAAARKSIKGRASMSSLKPSACASRSSAKATIDCLRNGMLRTCDRSHGTAYSRRLLKSDSKSRTPLLRVCESCCCVPSPRWQLCGFLVAAKWLPLCMLTTEAPRRAFIGMGDLHGYDVVVTCAAKLCNSRLGGTRARAATLLVEQIC